MKLLPLLPAVEDTLVDMRYLRPTPMSATTATLKRMEIDIMKSMSIPRDFITVDYMTSISSVQELALRHDDLSAEYMKLQHEKMKRIVNDFTAEMFEGPARSQLGSPEEVNGQWLLAFHPLGMQDRIRGKKVRKWCVENCRPDSYSVSDNGVLFPDREDATLCYLRFKGVDEL